eukprot:3932872-Rhodomonas_salina.4
MQVRASGKGLAQKQSGCEDACMSGGAGREEMRRLLPCLARLTLLPTRGCLGGLLGLRGAARL